MLREYAAERLEKRGPGLGKARLGGASGQEEGPEPNEDEAGQVRRYHAQYYLAMAEAADLQKSPDEQVMWLDRLERDHDNLRAAIGWAIDSGRMDMAARLCAALWSFWKTRGYVSEGRSWLDTVLANPSGVEPRTLAKVTNAAGALARFQGDYALAKALCEQGLAIYMECDDKPGIAESLDNLGVTLHYMGRIDEAEAKYQESAEVWHSLGGNDVVSRALRRLAMIVGSRNNRERAISLFRQTLAMNRTLKDKAGMCNSLYNLGVQLAGQWDGEEDGTECGPGAEAKRYFTLSFALASKLGNRNMIALSLIKLGELSLKPGDEPSLITATALIEEGLARVTEMGDQSARAYALHDLGFAALLRGDRSKARKHYNESLELSRALDDKLKVVMNLEALAIVQGKNALASGNRASAVRNAGRAVQLYTAIGGVRGQSSLAVKERHYRATMDLVLGLLSDDELSEYQALGQQMSLDEAVSFAKAN
jgi:tetratricopeptide (TPR) repeat protein